MKAFLTGFGIGVALGVLFAPDRGDVTRRAVRERVSNWRDLLNRQPDSARESVASRVNAGSETVSGGKEQKETAEGASKRPQAHAEPPDVDSINTATREELLSINGIGPVLADRIISGRPYSSLRELLDRGIIPHSLLEEVKRRFGPPEQRSA